MRSGVYLACEMMQFKTRERFNNYFILVPITFFRVLIYDANIVAGMN